MKGTARKGFIYFRYLFPIFVAVIMLILTFVPCYRYVTADTGLNEAISAKELLSNSWDTVREYLFGGKEQVQVTADFAGTLFGIIIIFCLLFAVGFASAVYCAVVAFRFFADGGRESKQRILFITLFPNRIVLSVCYALTLPLLFLPKIMPLLYDGILKYHVELICEPFDMVWIDIALVAAVVAVILISARYETLCEMNVFVRYREDEEEEEYEEQYAVPEDEDAFTEMDRRTREEQNERILRLLNKSEEDDTDEQENK